MNKYPLYFSFLLCSSALGVASLDILSLATKEASFNETFYNSNKNRLLNGIFLSGPQTTLSQNEKDVLSEKRTLEVKNVEIPGGIESLRVYLQPFFNDQPLTSELIAEIKNAIISYFRTHGHPVLAIDIPEQDITEGVLHFVLTEGKLHSIITRGNRWFSSKLLKSYIRLKPGQEIDSDLLLEDLSWMNRNPFHTTDLIFTPGGQEETTDIELITKDRFPLRFYVGGDNTGTVETGQGRLFAGFNWGNAFGCDQQLTYQATFSSDGNKFRAHTVNYVAPLPWRHILQIYGGYAQIRPQHEHDHHSQNDEFHSEGHSFQSSLRYTIPIPPTYKAKEREWVVGVDYKNTNNNLEFIEPRENPIITNTVNLFQVMLGYNLGIARGKHQFAFSAELYVSPGDFLPHQSNKTYARLRPGAKNVYTYTFLTLYDTYQLPKRWSLFFQTRGQLSSTSLLPSEQFGLGGYDTVRGYDEREVNADSGCCGNLELRTPSFSLIKNRDDLYFLAFLDYGLSIEYAHVHGRAHTQQLCSTGPGIRYRLGNYISLRADLGYRLIPIHDGQDKGWKVNFGALLSY